MPNHKGPRIGSIVSTTKKGDHNYGVLKISNQSIIGTKKTEEPPITSSLVLCTFQIPFHISIPEFLEFVAPVDSFVSHYIIIGNVTPDAYMVLMKFRDPYSANNYYRQYNYRQFSSMDSEVCQVIYVESIEIDSMSITPFAFYQQYDEDDDTVSNCPVCLEPMDESSTGLLTILCQHTFHCHCLSKWADGSCPVCRYSQKNITSMKTVQVIERNIGDENNENECSECHSKENLWICLICGHIGCGRYAQAHAYDHYTQSNHLYSLEIETQRVWDYAGDGYVHRLIQNAVDGKLVELPSTTEDPNASQEKVEAMSLEYNYLLSSQLDSQRIYYEDQMNEIATQLSSLTADTKSLLAQSDQLQNENEAIEKENALKENQIHELAKTKETTDNKLQDWKEKTQTTKAALLREKEIANSLLEGNVLLMNSIKEKEKAIQEFADQVRDIKFFLEARERVQEHPELEGGSVGTHVPQVRHTKRRGRRS